MILVKTLYKAHNGEFWAIVKALKTERHYLEGYKYEDLISTDQNKLCYFTDINNLSSQQNC